MKITRAKGGLRGKQSKLSDKQQKELGRMHGTGQYTISDLAELFTISRPTVYPSFRSAVISVFIWRKHIWPLCWNAP